MPAERTVSGGHGGGETPVPIPNTAVKPARADGTWGEAPWESRSPPGFLIDEVPSELLLEGTLSFPAEFIWALQPRSFALIKRLPGADKEKRPPVNKATSR